MLIAAVNPYHLTTREPAAVAALLLAERTVTLMPAPAAGRSREQVAEAVERSPSYLRLMESWRWSIPLWKDGLIGSTLEGERADADVAEAREAVWREESLSVLRGLMHEERRREDEEFLEGLCADMLRAGPDPSFALPLAAGLDRFAARRGLVAFRSQTASVAQRAEARLSRRVFAMSTPVPRDATAERIERWRGRGAAALAEARAAIEAAFDGAEAVDAEVERAAESARVVRAGQGVAEATGEGDARFLSLRGVLLPADAVLRAGAAAVSAMVGRAGAAGARLSVTTAPMEGEAGTLRAIVVKPIAARPA
jgi:hypothetical protein